LSAEGSTAEVVCLGAKGSTVGATGVNCFDVCRRKSKEMDYWECLVFCHSMSG
jgi:hypothetical protein